MITIGISKWTTESANELGKCFLKMKPLPDFVQMVGPYTYPDGDEGITAITIFKYDKTKSGATIKNDMFARLTFFWKFK